MTTCNCGAETWGGMHDRDCPAKPRPKPIDPPEPEQEDDTPLESCEVCDNIHEPDPHSEPTMEEILGAIRRIVTTDEED